jgi:hypothetical protein
VGDPDRARRRDLGGPGANPRSNLFGYQVCGLLAGLTMPAVTHRLGARPAATICSLPVAVGALGLLAAPGAIALWVVLAGAASGMTLVGALSLPHRRRRRGAKRRRVPRTSRPANDVMPAGRAPLQTRANKQAL